MRGPGLTFSGGWRVWTPGVHPYVGLCGQGLLRAWGRPVRAGRLRQAGAGNATLQGHWRWWPLQGPSWPARELMTGCARRGLAASASFSLSELCLSVTNMLGPLEGRARLPCAWRLLSPGRGCCPWAEPRTCPGLAAGPSWQAVGASCLARAAGQRGLSWPVTALPAPPDAQASRTCRAAVPSTALGPGDPPSAPGRGLAGGLGSKPAQMSPRPCFPGPRELLSWDTSRWSCCLSLPPGWTAVLLTPELPRGLREREGPTRVCLGVQRLPLMLNFLDSSRLAETPSSAIERDLLPRALGG